MKIAIIGYGKMGKEVESRAHSKGHQIVAIISSEEDWELKVEEIKSADVAIEFSQPDQAVSNIIKCFNIKLPVICGTTGWFGNLSTVKNECFKLDASLVYSSNFSIGVNLFFKLNESLAKMMNSVSNYDVEIEEIHHIQKLDAPSGTAISLANQITDNLERKTEWVKEFEENSNQIPIKSLRIADVTGIHSVTYSSEIDLISIRHEAYNRKGFAAGAIFAAEWIVNNQGCYDFKDILFNKA